MYEKPYSHPRFWENPGFRPAECNSCIHYYGYNKCEAYPDGIPRGLGTVVSHTEMYEGDNGIRYEKGVPKIRKPNTV